MWRIYKIENDDEEGIIEEIENLIEKKDVIIDETEDLDRLFDPCTRTEVTSGGSGEMFEDDFLLKCFCSC